MRVSCAGCGTDRRTRHARCSPAGGVEEVEVQVGALAQHLLRAGRAAARRCERLERRTFPGRDVRRDGGARGEAGDQPWVWNVRHAVRTLDRAGTPEDLASTKDATETRRFAPKKRFCARRKSGSKPPQFCAVLRTSAANERISGQSNASWQFEWLGGAPSGVTTRNSNLPPVCGRIRE